MRNDELTIKLARSARVTTAEAADQLDIVVHDILQKLRSGRPANLPGLGKLTPDNENGITFSANAASKAGTGKPASKDAPKRSAKSGGRK